MSQVRYRIADLQDIAEMARLRALAWETQEYWQDRVLSYVSGAATPQKALRARAAFVASPREGHLCGFIAGHLTTRLGCQGEVQWINVETEFRGIGVSTQLLLLLFEWFVEQSAARICVNVEPDNEAAIRFYTRHGAQRWNAHWLVWPDVPSVLANAQEHGRRR